MSALGSISALAGKCFDIFAAKSYSLSLRSSTRCQCSYQPRLDRNHQFNRDDFILWANSHTELKRNCDFGFFFRLSNAARPHNLRLDKMKSHKLFPGQEWDFVLGGVKCSDFTVPGQNPPAGGVDLTENIRDSAHTNLYMVPNVVVNTARQKRNMERGNENALNTMAPFYPKKKKSQPTNTLLNQIRYICSSINDELFLLRSQYILHDNILDAHSIPSNLVHSALDVEKQLLILYRGIENAKKRLEQDISQSELRQQLTSPEPTPLPPPNFDYIP